MALQQGLCPAEEALRRTLMIRNDPLRYKDSGEIQLWLSTLGDTIQIFADVLEKELERTAEKQDFPGA